MTEFLFARLDDVNASAAQAATEAAEQYAAAAQQSAVDAAEAVASIGTAVEDAQDAAAASQAWSEASEGWADAAEGWYDGAEYWANQAQGWAVGAQGWAEVAQAAAETLNLGATNLAGGTTGQVPVKNSNANYDFSWVTLSAGTVTSVDITPPAAGIGASGGPITSSGAITLVLLNDLLAVESLSTTGIPVRTGTDTWTTRSLAAPAAGFTITNPAGIAGNITFVLANDLAALEGLGTTGFAVRTGTDTWATRSFVMPAAGITMTNTAGIAGNMTIALANDLAAVEGLATTGIVRRTATDTWSAGTAVALSELATIAANTLLGNNTGGAAVPAALTKAQAVALLDAAQLSVYGQALAGGANTNRNYLGNTSGGGLSIDPGNGPIQLFVNGAAATISPASGKYGICTLFIQNSGGSGALAFTGYTVIGDTVGTGSSDRYICTVVQTQDVSLLIVKKYV